MKHAANETQTHIGQQDVYGRTFMQSLFSFSSLLSFILFLLIVFSQCLLSEIFVQLDRVLVLFQAEKALAVVKKRLEKNGQPGPAAFRAWNTQKTQTLTSACKHTHTDTHTLFPSLPQALNTSVSCWVEFLSSIPQSIIYTNVCLVVNQIMCPAGRVLHILWLQESQVIWKWNASV